MLHTAEHKNFSALIEIHFLPSVYYLTLNWIFDSVIIEQWENYNKGSFRNKCIIQSNHGQQYLIVPLFKGKNTSQSIREVRISYENDWLKPLKQRLQSEFGKYPYYAYYIDDLLEIFHQKWDRLFDLNIHLLAYFHELIALPSLQFTEGFQKTLDPYTIDFRDRINSKYFQENPNLLNTIEIDYFTFVPGHSVTEALFSYGPEIPLLFRRYAEVLIDRHFHND